MQSRKVCGYLLCLNLLIFIGAIRGLPMCSGVTTISDNEIYFRANDGMIEYFGETKGDSWENAYQFNQYFFDSCLITFDFTHLCIIFSNCTFDNSRIIISKSDHIRFVNCTFQNLETERYIKTYGEPEDNYWVSEILIENCRFEGNGQIDGIEFEHDRETIIRNSTFVNFYESIKGTDNRNMIIENCIINRSQYGIHLRGANNSIIRGNIIEQAAYSIALEIRHIIYFRSEGFVVVELPTRDGLIYNNVFNKQNAVGIDKIAFNNTWYSASEKRGNWYSDYLFRYPNAENNSIYFDIPYMITDQVADPYPLVRHLGYFNFSTSAYNPNQNGTSNDTDSTETNPFSELLWILGISAAVVVGGIGLWFLGSYIYRRVKNR